MDCCCNVKLKVKENKIKLNTSCVQILGEPLSIKDENINYYKYLDYVNFPLNDGNQFTDEEYIESENLLQELYKRIMGVN